MWTSKRPCAPSTFKAKRTVRGAGPEVGVAEHVVDSSGATGVVSQPAASRSAPSRAARAPSAAAPSPPLAIAPALAPVPPAAAPRPGRHPRPRQRPPRPVAEGGGRALDHVAEDEVDLPPLEVHARDLHLDLVAQT